MKSPSLINRAEKTAAACSSAKRGENKTERKHSEGKKKSKPKIKPKSKRKSKVTRVKKASTEKKNKKEEKEEEEEEPAEKRGVFDRTSTFCCGDSWGQDASWVFANFLAQLGGSIAASAAVPGAVTDEERPHWSDMCSMLREHFASLFRTGKAKIVENLVMGTSWIKIPLLPGADTVAMPNPTSSWCTVPGQWGPSSRCLVQRAIRATAPWHPEQDKIWQRFSPRVFGRIADIHRQDEKRWGAAVVSEFTGQVMRAEHHFRDVSTRRHYLDSLERAMKAIVGPEFEYKVPSPVALEPDPSSPWCTVDGAWGDAAIACISSCMPQVLELIRTSDDFHHDRCTADYISQAMPTVFGPRFRPKLP